MGSEAQLSLSLGWKGMLRTGRSGPLGRPTSQTLLLRLEELLEASPGINRRPEGCQPARPGWDHTDSQHVSMHAPQANLPEVAMASFRSGSDCGVIFFTLQPRLLLGLVVTVGDFHHPDLLYLLVMLQVDRFLPFP